MSIHDEHGGLEARQKQMKERNKLIVQKKFQEYLQGNTDSSFGNKLFTLIIKADLSNRNLLAKGFPIEVEVVNDYNGITKRKA